LFAYLDSRGPVDVAFTDRHGGVSTGPFASLNLAHGGADQAASVAENLRLVAAGLAAETGGPVPAIALMRQVHGAQVAVVDEPAVSAADAPECDGLVTRLPGIALTVRVADCVPVLLADLDAGVVGAAHAGRPGLVAGIVPATVARMRSEGATRLRAWVGPHVCSRCYEVPADMRDDVAGVVPESCGATSGGLRRSTWGQASTPSSPQRTSRSSTPLRGALSSTTTSTPTAGTERSQAVSPGSSGSAHDGRRRRPAPPGGREPGGRP
jgi:YfiH family protein